jgi:heat shock protein HslJ
VKNLFSALLLLTGFILIACHPFATSDKTTKDVDHSFLVGIWIIDEIGGEQLVDASGARIQFATDGAINGNSGCNRFFGKYGINNGQFSIDPLGSTRMMCLPTLMLQEQRLLELLPMANKASMEKDKLVLHDVKNKIVIKASREKR